MRRGETKEIIKEVKVLELENEKLVKAARRRLEENKTTRGRRRRNKRETEWRCDN